MRHSLAHRYVEHHYREFLRRDRTRTGSRP
jgi:hypothetical protein